MIGEWDARGKQSRNEDLGVSGSGKNTHKGMEVGGDGGGSDEL